MRAYIQTRGPTADYAFLGEGPPTRWWLDFRDATSFEQPTLIVTGEQGKWRCYLSGIPSRRTDRVGTAIRYTVVLEGECGEETTDAFRLAAAWLHDIANGTLNRSVQPAMDGVFDEAEVQRCLSRAGPTAETANKAERLAKAAIASLPPSVQPSATTPVDSWAGSINSPQARMELLARIGALFSGERQGAAALLNLLDAPEEVSLLASHFQNVGPVGVLINDTAGVVGDGIVFVEKKKLLQGPHANPAAQPRQADSVAGRCSPAWSSTCRRVVDYPDAVTPSPSPRNESVHHGGGPRAPHEAAPAAPGGPAQDASKLHIGAKHLPLDGFTLTVLGTWRGYQASEPLKTLRIELSGIWKGRAGLFRPALAKLRTKHSAAVEGVVFLDDVVGAAPLRGTLTVKSPELAFHLCVLFTDSTGNHWSINASAQSVLNAARDGVKGTLTRADLEFGEVHLKVDSRLVREALPSHS